MENLREIAAHFDIPLVKESGTISDVKKFIDSVVDETGVEGYILRFADGHMAKIKVLEYLKFHRAISAISQEKNVWALILDENVDDLKSFLQEEDRKRVEAFETDLWNEIGVMEDNLVIKFNSARCEVGLGDEREQKKDFAMAVMEYHPSIKSLLFAMYDGKDCRELVINFIRNNLGTGTKLDKIRPLFNGVRFEEVEYEE